MTWLRNSWYQAGWSEEVRAGSPLVRTILGEPILLYRDAQGDVAALLDRCPHRFAPLSAGQISDGTVTCGYHGLAFSGSGKCIRNPHGPITTSMRVRAYPVMERHCAMWIWMGDSEAADPDLIPDLSFIDETPESARVSGYMPTHANYMLVADNILDLSHADYLHPTSLGGIITDADARSWEDGDRVVAEWNSLNCDPPPAYRPALPPGVKADIWTRVIWQAPAVMVLGTAAKPTGIARTRDDEAHTLHNMVPETESSTHYFFCATRRFLVDDAGFSAYLRQALTHAFEHEDKWMLEKQQARIGSADFWGLKPVLLPTDKAAVLARRKLDKLISAEAQAHRPSQS